ncbi:MAG: hypothetical protein JEZ03_13890 [Bacteroidales bacterium]|nr:hypothetical protein [Bacteroidales bacterium]
MIVDSVSENSIRVWTYKPKAWTDTNKILFVMHGMNRNAEDYLDSWRQFAEAYRLLLVAPEFANDNFQEMSDDYQEGNVLDASGALNPKAEWAFTVVENIFDTIIRNNQYASYSYHIFGHSGGAQFVHRMLLFLPENRIEIAIAANAGYYTFVDFDMAYPYGIGNTEIHFKSLTQSFKQKLIILLGEQDQDSNHIHLRQSTAANSQGEHRLERGTNFYQNAKEYAEQHQLDFYWQLDTIKNVGHNHHKMASRAVMYLYQNFDKLD